MSEFERIALAVTLALLYLVFTWLCYHRHGWRLNSRHRQIRGDVIIAYASQSGRAHALAVQCQRGFNGNTSLIHLNQLTPQHLTHASTLLVFASTYGDGEAPDNGATFEKRMIKQQKLGHNLTGIQFVVIALGDSYYTDFCAFGYRVYNALKQMEAKPLAECITLDASKPSQEHAALLQVQSLMQDLGGKFYTDTAKKSVIPERCTISLEARTLLNKNSPGAPLYWLQLTSDQPLSYSAGDIAEVFPRHSLSVCRQRIRLLGLNETAPIAVNNQTFTMLDWLATRQWPIPDKPPHLTAEQWLLELPEVAPRQYTIANSSNAHGLQLVVRQHINEQGELGLASGWLTEHLECGGNLEIAIRDNQEFHTPPAEQPLILIGNGSGIAGLRAHLQHRANTGGEPCWLLYGERDSLNDRPFAQELAQLQKQGVIQQADWVYSRNGEDSEYVQDRLLRRGSLLQQWLDRNACIYVCGSRVGMGQGVQKALQTLLGEEYLQQLQADGRYRRDVY